MLICLLATGCATRRNDTGVPHPREPLSIPAVTQPAPPSEATAPRSPVAWEIIYPPFPDLLQSASGAYLAPPYEFVFRFSGDVDRRSVEEALDRNLGEKRAGATLVFRWKGNREVTVSADNLPLHNTFSLTPRGGKDTEGRRLSDPGDTPFQVFTQAPGDLWRFRPGGHPERIARFDQAYETVSLSPDGNSAFLRLMAPDTRPVGPTPGLGYLHDLKSGRQTRIGDLNGWIYVRWLPGGGLVAYGEALAQTKGWEGIAVHVDRAGNQTVLHRGSPVIGAFVDPQGRRAAIFTGGLEGADLLLIDLASGGKRHLPRFAVPASSPNEVPLMAAAWSPDGGVLAYRNAMDGSERDGEVWLFNPASEEKTRLAEGPVELNHFTSPWSPDGRSLYLGGVGVVDRDGKVLFPNPSPGNGFWSPRGDRIFIYGIGLVDTQTWRVLRPAEPDHLRVSWAPDGRYLLVEGLGLLDADGTLVKRVTVLGVTEALWSPSGHQVCLPEQRLLISLPEGEVQPVPDDAGDPPGKLRAIAWTPGGTDLLLTRLPY